MKEDLKMKMLYVAHPFSGDETSNYQDAERQRAELQEKYPDICFINPLSMFGGAETDYCLSLSLAFEVLSRCDGIILSVGWEDSGGCKAEKALAMRQGMTIHYIEEFLPEDM